MLVEVVDTQGHTILFNPYVVEMIDMITHEIVFTSGKVIRVHRDELERVLGVISHES